MNRPVLLLATLCLLAVGCTAQRRDGRASTMAPPPDDAARIESLCRDLDSPELQTRQTASRELQTHAGAVEGGTEQQMEAAAAVCARVTGKSPSWLATSADSAHADASCPPLGRWRLQAAMHPCTGIERFDVQVAAGLPPDSRLVLPPSQPIVAAGRTNTGQPYETLLIVSDPQPTSAGCSVQLHLEYLGPHEMLTYDARVQIERGRLQGKGQFDYEADDCKKPDPEECSCLSDVSLTGQIAGSR